MTFVISRLLLRRLSPALAGAGTRKSCSRAVAGIDPSRVVELIYNPRSDESRHRGITVYRLGEGGA